METPADNIKRSEARILIFLSVAAPERCFASAIAAKLNIDYAYVLRMLSVMKEKNWIQPLKRQGKTFYKLGLDAPLLAAEGKISKNNN